MTRKMMLVLGGARSGKSTYAQNLALENRGRVVYVATAEAKDEEMQERIAVHRKERPSHWLTLEAATQVGKRIELMVEEADMVLLDCMTLLTSNVILQLPEAVSIMDAQNAMDEELHHLIDVYMRSDCEWIIVSNEVGMGLVPPYALGRIYRDVLGRVNQQLAQIADEVLFLVAGLPMKLK